MKRFFTSDLHFGHKNVIDFCHRPYKDVVEMDAAIVKQWNSQVGPDDEVYFIGDFGINKKKALDGELVRSLNGKKYMILGNHDTGFSRLHQLRNIESIKNQYTKAGWYFVDIALVRTLSNGQKCILTHLPMSSDEDTRYSEYKIKSIRPGMVQLHGHLHGHYKKKGNMIDVCFDADLVLLSEDDIINIIEDERDYIPTRLTEKYKMAIHESLRPYESEVSKKSVRKVVDGDLVLYNYTDKCTFDKSWNNTTKNSRGIIFNSKTGELVAKPFPKFFNLSELSSTQQRAIVNGSGVYSDYTVHEKMDGSLGIIYDHEGKWRVATRGSFSSNQAKKAEIMLSMYNMTEVPPELTLLVEIIYPENKIVVNYGQEEKLTLLSAFNTEVGEEVSPETMQLIKRDTGMPMAATYNHTIIQLLDLQKIIPKDDEGFVVRFSNGVRVKIKGDEYMRIHRLISQMTPLCLWDTMVDGKVGESYLQELPEEFRKEVDQIANALEASYSDTKDDILDHLDSMIMSVGFGSVDDESYRKKVGLFLKDTKPMHGSLLFPVLLKKERAIDLYVLSVMRPSNNII